MMAQKARIGGPSVQAFGQVGIPGTRTVPLGVATFLRRPVGDRV